MRACEWERISTREVADSNGDTGDGDETEVVEGAEIANNSGEGRVPIYDRVFGLGGGCDISVHFAVTDAVTLTVAVPAGVLLPRCSLRLPL